MVIICDIDGTICNPVKENGQWVYIKHTPIVDRIERMNKLYDEGHTIIYWTARGSTSGIDHSELTQRQLDEWGVKYSELRLGKPSYDIWIDDKAFNDKAFFNDIPNWP
jgi:hypothetical protein